MYITSAAGSQDALQVQQAKLQNNRAELDESAKTCSSAGHELSGLHDHSRHVCLQCEYMQCIMLFALLRFPVCVLHTVLQCCTAGSATVAHSVHNAGRA